MIIKEGKKIFYINSSIPVSVILVCGTFVKTEIKLTITDNDIGFNIHQNGNTV
jgi:hypothetical protein